MCMASRPRAQLFLQPPRPRVKLQKLLASPLRELLPAGPKSSLSSPTSSSTRLLCGFLSRADQRDLHPEGSAQAEEPPRLPPVDSELKRLDLAPRGAQPIPSALQSTGDRDSRTACNQRSRASPSAHCLPRSLRLARPSEWSHPAEGGVQGQQLKELPLLSRPCRGLR